MIDVTVLLLDGGFLSTAIGPLEVFSCAGVLWNVLGGGPPCPRFRVTAASADGDAARPDAQLRLTTGRALSEVGAPDLVWVPAAGLDLETLTTTGFDVDAAVTRNARVIPWLQRQAARGAEIAAVCSGVALLAAAGLLDGRRATTHWALADLFRRRFPAVDWRPEYLVTEAPGVYCGGGVNAASDLSLYLVEKFCGREVATQCAQAMLLELPRTWQVAFAHLDVGRGVHEDEAILRAQEWLHEHYDRREIRLEALACRLGMSPRNFIRRFKEATGRTPLAYLQSLRIAAARRLLENGRGTIQEISVAVGYDDLMFFRSLFRRHTGLSPTEYRQRFGRPRPATAAA
jgi:transcriptional regulator GlxA family with amidase domain